MGSPGGIGSRISTTIVPGRRITLRRRQNRPELRATGRHAPRPGAPPDYKTGIVLLYDALGVPCLPVALNSGLFWPRRSVIRRPGTIVVEILDPIPPGLPKAEFLRRLETAIEGASNRLLVEGGAPEPARGYPVNPSLT